MTIRMILLFIKQRLPPTIINLPYTTLFRSLRGLGHDDDLRPLVEFRDQHIDTLRRADRDLLSDYVGVDRQLSSAAIDQHRQRDRCRTPEVGELVEGRPDRTSGIENNVHDDDVFAIEAPRKVRGPYDRARSDGLQVVAVQGDVE